jgi:hypothetical protein
MDDRPAAIDMRALNVKRRNGRVAPAMGQLTKDSVLAALTSARRLGDLNNLFPGHRAPSIKKPSEDGNAEGDRHEEIG